MTEILITDNEGLRRRFKWFGNPDHPWLFEASGNAWIWALFLVPTWTWLLWILAPRPLIAAVAPGFGGYFLTGVASATGGLVIGIVLTRWIGRHVTPTEPLAHHIATLLGEMRAPRDTGRATRVATVPETLEQKHRVTHRIAVPTTTED